MKKEIIVNKNPKSQVSESFRALRTNLQFMNDNEDENKIIEITSTNQGEGKSFVATNLATTFAQAEKKTLIIDADMRRPRQHSILQCMQSPGLSTYLTTLGKKNKTLEAKDCIKKTRIENLYLLPAGNIPPNPSELLQPENLLKLFDEIEGEFDVIIIDSAPCLLVTDGVIISRYADFVVLVASENQTKMKDLKEAEKKIKQVGGNIAGVVLNKVKMSKKKYEYSYYYGKENEVLQHYGINREKHHSSSHILDEIKSHEEKEEPKHEEVKTRTAGNIRRSSGRGKRAK